ncbi:MAG: agmatine deiminase family protein [Sphingomonadaceae bacterium]
MSSIRPPAEWAAHEAVWIGFPSHPDLWEEDLEPARAEVLAFARAVHDGGRGERVILVAANDAAAGRAAALAGDMAEIVLQPFGDIWLRDTAPIIASGISGRFATDFLFNFWGGKYDLPGDESIGARLAANTGFPIRSHDWILEGGAIDGDGTGLAVTTEQCLLNPNRNPDLTRGEIEQRLREQLGLARILWLGDGLLNDHTDGHVDNLARFVSEGRLLLPVAAGEDDPNADVYADAARRASSFGVEVVPMPSPGLVERDGEIVPASYMNFYIGNHAVVMPTYEGAANEEAAIETLSELFPGRTVVGIPADAILTGGGSFHCISQQIPA